MGGPGTATSRAGGRGAEATRAVEKAVGIAYTSAGCIVRTLGNRGTMTNNDVLYGQTTIPVGIRSRLVDNNNGITMHILEAGFEEPGRPLILLMHGYPELAFSWRKNL